MNPQRTPPQQIALAFPRGAHQEAFIGGILRYANRHGRDWSLLTAPESPSLSVLNLRGWPGDGVLAALNTTAEADAAEAMPIPVVNVSSALHTPGIPTSIVDNRAIGRLAAEHLLSKGFSSFAYFGLERVRYSADRQAGFEAQLNGSGVTVDCHLAAPTFGLQGTDWREQHLELATWLGGLPTPCGLLAVSDHRARQALDACRQVGLRVPEQVAIVGVDNERVICEHAPPPLSSVARNDELEGYRAAELLDRLMRGERGEAAAPVPPIAVVQRESTASHAVADERLRVALEYIDEHLGDPLTIGEITEHACVSRRWLEYAFREAFGETPYQYLRRRRLWRAKLMLGGGDAPKITDVALRTGFNSGKQMAASFQQEFGVSPSQWRKGARC